MKNWINNIHTVLILELYVRLIKRTVQSRTASDSHYSLGLATGIGRVLLDLARSS